MSFSAPTPAPPPSNAERKRLHITPFNADLFDRYVPSSLRPLASAISFRAVQTFPDRGFGYVELPAMEADKLKNKLNGSTLKGSKVKIEDARPEKKRKVETTEDENARKVRKKAKKEKRKREENVIAGHELEEGRHVKRGWTDDGVDKKTMKKAKKSKSHKEDAAGLLDGKKLRFKTAIPPNALPVETKPKAEAKDNDKKVKKEKKDKTEKKKRDAREKRKAVVEEFAKTKKPIISVGGAPTGKGVCRYEDGKGWVDDEGNVVEAERPSKKPRQAQPALLSEDEHPLAQSQGSEDLNALASKTPAENDDDPVDDEGSSLDAIGQKTLDDSDLDEGSEWEENGIQPVQPPAETVDRVTKATESSSVHTDDEAEEDVKRDADDDADATVEAKEVHPLEALFKRAAHKPESATKPKPQPIDTSFSFFNSGAADEDEDLDQEASFAAYPPQTPHTKRDLEWRSLRSAAPTPDTAAIGRKFSFPFAGGEEDEDGDEDEEEDAAEAELGAVQEDEALPDANQVPVKGSEEAQKEESEFRKWFYENRGALNRGWKKRRREERKAKRQRENRRLSRRVV